MGCLNGKHVLTDETLDYITNHTKASHDEIKQYHQMFLDEHPKGKITKRCFRKVVQACHPSMDVTGLGNFISMIFIPIDQTIFFNILTYPNSLKI